MDESGTREVEQPAGAESGADGDTVQFDLFGMPVEQAPAAKAQTDRRQPRAMAADATSLWQDDEAPPDEAAAAGHEATSTEAAAAGHGATSTGIAAADRGAISAAAAAAAPAAAPPKKRRSREILAAAPSPEVFALAADMPPQIHLGTSTWSFPGWNGIVYRSEERRVGKECRL